MERRTRADCERRAPAEVAAPDTRSADPFRTDRPRLRERGVGAATATPLLSYTARTQTSLAAASPLTGAVAVTQRWYLAASSSDILYSSLGFVAHGDD